MIRVVAFGIALAGSAVFLILAGVSAVAGQIGTTVVAGIASPMAFQAAGLIYIKEGME